jgi:Asp-tRNA(Asn)/Glu-tRNA(Gln) amidotransferase A subunit family amidase
MIEMSSESSNEKQLLKAGALILGKSNMTVRARAAVH